jgi:hypothetical protein
MARDYRDAQTALVDRRAELERRVAALDDTVDAEAVARLTAKQKTELAAMKKALEPADDSVAALVKAEEAADRYRAWLSEALDLASALDEHVPRLLPNPYAIAKTVAYLVLGVALVFLVMWALFSGPR